MAPKDNVLSVGPLNKLFADIMGRGIRIRVLTGFNAGNISSCKKNLIGLVDEDFRKI